MMTWTGRQPTQKTQMNKKKQTTTKQKKKNKHNLKAMRKLDLFSLLITLR